ncbi:MAG: hypothetical protein BWZ10_01570 [candidate division BRC1 bacterium ADurb.BinA364]|nr:MAG: hypothetical protein BWZ10_01570 [candidate division BRC1 bacterium ADurb.BinA364]
MQPFDGGIQRQMRHGKRDEEEQRGVQLAQAFFAGFEQQTPGDRQIHHEIQRQSQVCDAGPKGQIDRRPIEWERQSGHGRQRHRNRKAVNHQQRRQTLAAERAPVKQPRQVAAIDARQRQIAQHRRSAHLAQQRKRRERNRNRENDSQKEADAEGDAGERQPSCMQVGSLAQCDQDRKQRKQRQNPRHDPG